MTYTASWSCLQHGEIRAIFTRVGINHLHDHCVTLFVALITARCHLNRAAHTASSSQWSGTNMQMMESRIEVSFYNARCAAHNAENPRNSRKEEAINIDAPIRGNIRARGLRQLHKECTTAALYSQRIILSGAHRKPAATQTIWCRRLHWLRLAPPENGPNFQGQNRRSTSWWGRRVNRSSGAESLRGKVGDIQQLSYNEEPVWKAADFSRRQAHADVLVVQRLQTVPWRL